MSKQYEMPVSKYFNMMIGFQWVNSTATYPCVSNKVNREFNI